MDIHDPNTWTKFYVKIHTRECLNELWEVCALSAKYVREKNYKFAIAGLDRVLNGLILLNNHTAASYWPHMCMLSWMEGLVLMSITDAPDEKALRETVGALLLDARDWARSETTKRSLDNLLSLLKSGRPMKDILIETEGTEDVSGIVSERMEDIAYRLRP